MVSFRLQQALSGLTSAKPPTSNPSSPDGPSNSLLAGFLAGSSTRIAVEHAPDTVKTHMQRHGLPFATACKHILKKNGCRGFFKGLPAPAIASGLETALLFGPYTKAIEHLAPGIPTPELPIPIVLSAGGFAGIVASFILTPFEHVKIKAQLSETNRSSVQILRTLIAQGGFRRLYHGHGACMLRESATSLWFGGYELTLRARASSKQIPRDQLTAVDTTLASMVAGTLFWISYPVDTVKTYQQAAEYPISFLNALRKLVHTEGLSVLCRGLGITIIRGWPANAMIFLVYEACMKQLKKTA